MADKPTTQSDQPPKGPATDKPAPEAHPAPAARSLVSSTRLTDLTVSELSAIVASEVALALGRAGSGTSHVNSGPPGFVNGGGHANFDPRVATQGTSVNPALAGVHVNSGPPGFVNGGGHANFDPRVAAGGISQVSRVAAGGSHVNSGPPGFVNGGGHANFDPSAAAGGILQVSRVAAGGSHVNSGPPGFVNGGGHANFDPTVAQFGNLVITLPDRTSLAVPATGPLNLRVRGFQITR